MIDAQAIVIAILVGLVAGWLASFIVGGGGSALRYIVLGIIGGVVGNYLFSVFKIRMPIADPLIAQIVVAAIGAIILVLVVRAVARS